MNSPTTEKPAPPPAQTDAPEYHVACKLTLCLPVPLFFPTGNYAAALLLATAFNRALRGKALLIEDRQWASRDFNDFYFLAAVKNSGQALREMETVLLEAGIFRPFATLLFFRRGDEFGRPVGVDGAGIGTNFTLDKFIEVLKRNSADQNAMLQWVKNLWEPDRKTRGLPALPVDPENPAAPQ